MKWTDENIDKLFQEGADKQSFAFKQEYWEEFSADLSDHAPLSETSDEALDTAFQESAANQSFDYKPEYWDAFAASLPSDAPLSQAPDASFDSAFQENAAAISVDYKPEFWNEFSDSLSSSIAATENVTDIEVDAMYREEAANLSFVYQPSYWEEMAAMLRRRRRRPEFLWFGLSSIFATAFIALLFVEQSPLQMTWNTPEYAFGELTPEAAQAQNRSIAANNSANSGSSNALNYGNEFAQGSLVNGKTPSTPVANNENIAMNNGANSNTGLSNTNPAEGTPNATDGMIRMNRIMPQLIVTASYTPSVTAGGRTMGELKELTPLNPRALEVSEVAFDNTLAETNYPNLLDYKGGIQSRLYVQGVTGVSQSLLANSDALSTSYGLGLGWQIEKRNWIFNLGSNLIVNNYSDIQITGEAVRHQDFSGGTVRRDFDFGQVMTAELDFSIGYSFGRHQFRLGIRPSYDVQSFVKEYEVLTMLSEDLEIDETISTSQGRNTEMDEFQRWGLKPTFGYAYSFASDWTLGLSLSAEVMPSISLTSKYETVDYQDLIGANRTLPIDGQLYIRKTLNFRK
ncbi:MAG: hypothetical protein Crog4KO_09070 [Crocinitomicaceae bacterium]